MATSSTKRYQTFYKNLSYKFKHRPCVGGLAITVDNCFYYLSLLESFYEIEQSLGPKLFRLYVIAAERRYIEFLRSCSMRCNSFYDWDNRDPVPLDIAYAWHAHLLSPYNYYEDIGSKRIYDYKYSWKDSAADEFKLQWNKCFPLKAMHLQRINNGNPLMTADGYPFEGQRRFFVYPWHLTKEHLERISFIGHIPPKLEYTPTIGYVQEPEEELHRRVALYIRCSSCKQRLYIQNWKHYAEYRTNPGVALKCPGFTCGKDTTVDSLAALELSEAVSHTFVKGTMLEKTGAKKKTMTDSEKKIRMSMYHDVFSRKDDLVDFKGRGTTMESVDQQTKSSIKEAKYYEQAKEFGNIIISTYKNNPTPLSIDLIQTMLRYRDFISTVVTKIIPKWDDPVAEIPNLIIEYYDFLILLKKQGTNSNNDSLTTILPSWTADIAWHVHMLHPEAYNEMMLSQLCRVPNHDNIIIPSEITEHLMATDKAWLDTSPSPLQNLGSSILKTSSVIFSKYHPAKPLYEWTGHSGQLGDKFVGNNIKKSSRTSAKIENVSYHNGDTQHVMSIHTGNIRSSLSHHPEETKDTSATLVPALTVDSNRALITKNIKHTGYGYTGTILDEIVRPKKVEKRIETVTYPALVSSSMISNYYGPGRCFGCIPPNSTIVLAHPLNPEYHLGNKTVAYSSAHNIISISKIEFLKHLNREKDLMNKEWWMPAKGLYGAMRRKYSKKSQQWGWTTDGFDWYSENVCNFKPSPKGEFCGARFYPENKNYKYASAYSGHHCYDAMLEVVTDQDGEDHSNKRGKSINPYGFDGASTLPLSPPPHSIGSLSTVFAAINGYSNSITGIDAGISGSGGIDGGLGGGSVGGGGTGGGDVGAGISSGGGD